jgi:hypothetical protein
METVYLNMKSFSTLQLRIYLASGAPAMLLCWCGGNDSPVGLTDNQNAFFNFRVPNAGEPGVLSAPHAISLK